MRSIKHTLQSLQDRRRRPKLPWAELEAEAARQACSPADIFFDWAGRPASAPPPGGIAPAPTLNPGAMPGPRPSPVIRVPGGRSSRDEHAQTRRQQRQNRDAIARAIKGDT